MSTIPLGSLAFHPRPKPTPEDKPKPPEESSLRLMLANNLDEGVQQLIDVHHMEFRIEKDKDGNSILVDSIKGADLWLKRFVTEDEETIQMKSDARLLSKVDDEVLITGETGTGKEIIARSMIGNRDGLFIAVNCAGLPESLIESELFGHEIGAFTGAVKSKKCMMKVAADGVLFLDEIGELPLNVQGKLLRALQEKVIRPVGANEETQISCRFVCATHRDLKEMVEKQLFRQDLYARISTFELHIKPLRNRKIDVVPIIKAIGKTLKMDSKIGEFLWKYADAIANDSIDLSLNVRSLEQTLKRYNVLGRV